MSTENKSTGPRTPEGKARSARNSYKHGLTAKDLIIRDDEREEFEALQESLEDELDPQGPLEELTFNQILHAAWNLRRFRRIEASLDIDPFNDQFDRLNRYARQAERSYYRGIRELRVMQTNRTIRDLNLDPTHREPPVYVWVSELTKRTPSGLTERAQEALIKAMEDEPDVRFFDLTDVDRDDSEPEAA